MLDSERPTGHTPEDLLDIHDPRQCIHHHAPVLVTHFVQAQYHQKNLVVWSGELRVMQARNLSRSYRVIKVRSHVIDQVDACFAPLGNKINARRRSKDVAK